MRFVQVLEEHLAAIKSSTPLTMDEAEIMPYCLQAQVLIEQLRFTLQGIKQFDEAIERVTLKHADYSLFSALPGVGPSLAPSLLMTFDEDRAHYRNAADLRNILGLHQ